MSDSSIRGEYDPERIRRAKSFLQRIRDSAMGDFDHDIPPPPERVDRAYRFALASIVIVLASAMIAVMALPGSAFLGRMVGIVADRLVVAGPGGKIEAPRIAQRSVIVGAEGGIVATLAGEENRRVVSLPQIAPIARNAVLAIEDARFFHHSGIDGAGLVRAVFANARAGQVREGGSTITQQLVKNVFVGNERTLERKLREAQYAVALEKEMTKSQILELYLNETYFGDGHYGIETAAEYFFGTPASKLDAVQSALLAGLIAAPERYNPFEFPERAKARRNTVLGRMAAEGFIERADLEKLKAAPLGVEKHPLPPAKEPYFVDFIKRQILDDPRFGATRSERAKALFQGGLRIETTLNLRLQDSARQAVDTVLDEDGDPAAALVSVEPATGAVRAMVGGRDFNSEQFNLAIGTNRQAGSTFKPFVMAAALDQGISPGLTLDTPSPYRTTDDMGKPWAPANYSNRGEGLMNMRKATELSVNTYYVQLIELVGPDKVVDMAKRLGITSPLEPYKSLSLGTFGVSPYEMASAYGTLANNGIACKPYTIRRVLAADGTEILRNDPSCTRVVDATIAATAVDILKGVIDRGTGRRNGQIGRPAAGKTGTTDDYTDAWFMGFTPQFSTAVWLGFPDSTERGLYNIHGLPQVFGGSLPAEIWNKFMKVAHDGLPAVAFPEPPTVEFTTVPTLVGLHRDDAMTQLKSAGLNVRTRIVSSSLSPGIVVAQLPSPGTEVEKGSLVEIQVSDGSEATSPPEPQDPTPEPYPSPTPSSSPNSTNDAETQERGR
ncbi:MAG TPA: PBP1A family penicillin-binding protein [Actinomycetota bacterium]|nr:PBP1A family penicillin-binding protein [Actinomycetota bacterium]